MTQFKIQPRDSGVIFEALKKRSAFIAAGIPVLPAPADGAGVVTHQFGKIKFEEHLFGDAQDKTEQPTTVVDQDVLIMDRYHADWFDKKLYTPQSAANELIRRWATSIDADIDEYIARTTPGRRWSGFQGTPAVITDGASFDEAEAAMAEADWDATSTVFDTKAKPLVKKILNESGKLSTVDVRAVDGISFGDTTAWFRNLHMDDANRIGYLIDPRGVAIFLRRGDTVVVSPGDDVLSQRKNAFYAKIEYSIGIGYAPGAVIPLDRDSSSARTAEATTAKAAK